MENILEVILGVSTLLENILEAILGVSTLFTASHTPFITYDCYSFVSECNVVK